MASSKPASEHQAGPGGPENQTFPHSQETGHHSPPKTEYLTHLPDDCITTITTAFGGPPPKRHSLLQHVWPAVGLNEGLYKQVLRYRYFAQYKFYIVSALYNLCLIAQLVLGAALTSMSASENAKYGIAITVIAAGNTVNAGLLALLHGSGLPNRLRSDMAEYEKVQMWMEEVMRGEVALGLTMTGGRGDSAVTIRDKVVGEATKRFMKARGTVEKNRPSAYTAASMQQHTSHSNDGHPPATQAPVTRAGTGLTR